MNSTCQTVISLSVDLIRQQGDSLPEINDLSTTDPLTFELFKHGDTIGVFQFESSGMRYVLDSAKPDCLNDLIALNALYRPTPLDSGVTDTFIHNKNCSERSFHESPDLDSILAETYGVVAYSEQVEEIFKSLGGLNERELNGYLKAMKARDTLSMEKYRESVLKEADLKKIKIKTIETLLDQIEAFGRFPVSRVQCALAALTSYRMAYLKANFLVEFLAAWITVTSAVSDDFSPFIRECNRNGIELSLPDINHSEKGCTVANGKIRLGLMTVRSVDDRTADAILAERQRHGDFKSFFDFCDRMDQRHINEHTLSGLIQSGAFDFSGLFRSQMMVVLDDATDRFRQGRNNQLKTSSVADQKPIQSDLLEAFASLPDIDDWDILTRIVKQQEALGAYINGHPAELYKKKVEEKIDPDILSLQNLPDTHQVCIAGMINKVKTCGTRSGGKMAFCHLEDESDVVEFHVFQEQYDEELLTVGKPVVVKGVLREDSFSCEKKILVKEIYSLE